MIVALPLALAAGGQGTAVMDLRAQIDQSCFAFRGYNITNLGRTPELLDHPAYGTIVERHLREASEIASEETGQTIDVIGQLRHRQETSLDTFPAAVALILATEVAQVELLSEFHGIEYRNAKLAMGYSLGEISAIVCAAVMPLADAMRIPVGLAKDCAELGENTRMGVLFSRGGVLPSSDVERLCVEINAEGCGVLGISAHLSPNTLLLLGQGDTVNRFDAQRKRCLPDFVHLRKNNSKWPPLHTPIVWERNISNRAGRRMHAASGGLIAPQPPILSLVTGSTSYNDHNTREILTDWTDHPQQVWSVVCETLAAGIKLVVHVGPEPNLFPSTYKRLAENVRGQLSGGSASSLGKRIVSGIVDRPWLATLLPSQAALLRAPAVEHLILEDWLLEEPVA